MFIAHAPISYLANEAVQGKKIKELKPGQEILIAFWSLLCGILPDFDMFVLMALNKPTFTHHSSITHTFIFWFGVFILLVILYKLLYKRFNKKTQDFLNEDFTKVFLLTFLIGTFVHLLSDMLVSGIMVLYPFSTKDYSALQYAFSQNYFTGYYTSFYIAIEFIFIAIFLFVISRKFLKRQKWDDPIAYILVAFSVIYLLCTAGIYSQTYNTGLLYDADGNVSEDVDFDGVKDMYDYDVNDNDINNIDEAVSSHLASSAENIVNSGKLAVAQKKSLNTAERILYKYGAFNSYRIISQAYFENRLPIEPVLGKEVKNRMENPSYDIEIIYPDELYTYFRNREELLSLDTTSYHLLPQGKIFFILDKDMNILNLGITLTDNYVGIVLPDDTRLVKHSFEEVLVNYDTHSVLFEIQE